MTPVPVIHVLSKQNYEDQHLVPLPSALPLPPLAPSSLRIATSIMSLTTNNFSYARFGHLLGWWDVHPLPPSIPAEYSNPKTYGRVSAWGYGTVLGSTLSGPEASTIKVGTQMYGYLPIGTLPVDMQVEVSQDVPGQFFEVSEARAKLMPIYNRYMFYPPAVTAEEKQKQGMDSLFQVLFETGYMMNRFLFAWDPKELVQPGTEMGATSESATAWKFEDGQIGEDTTMLLFSASGKTALAFAYELKHNRPAGSKPRMVVAVGSDSSRAFTEGTGLYDKILNYNADSTSDLAAELGLASKSKAVVCDFGSRDSAANRWAKKLKEIHNNTYFMGIGGEVVADTPDKTMEKFLARTGSMMVQINASGMRSQAMKVLGEKKYFEDFLKEWKSFKEGGTLKGLRLTWGEGMGNVTKGWERLYKGEVGPDEGLVFTLHNEELSKL
jgi:hypothetical protein